MTSDVLRHIARDKDETWELYDGGNLYMSRLLPARPMINGKDYTLRLRSKLRRMADPPPELFLHVASFVE